MTDLLSRGNRTMGSRTGTNLLVRSFTLLCLGVLAASCGSEGGVNEPTGAAPESTSSTEHLTAADVQTIIAQAATQAQAVGLPVTIAVVDHEGVVLGILRMANARADITIRGGGSGGPLEGQTLSTISVPSIQTAAAAAAISKAGTAAFFSTQGNAFSTRSASFIVQEHFPPHVDPSPGGPLFGVQFSQLRCSDVSRTGHPASTANLPLGLSGDLGGLPLYKNGTAVGGIGVEGDGFYTADLDPSDFDQSLEERIAAAGTLGFSAPNNIRGDKILIDGITIPFSNAEPPTGLNAVPYGSLSGTEIQAPVGSPATGFTPATVGGVSGTIDPGITIVASPDPGGLTVPEVTQILAQAAVQANRTRAAIRNPIGTPARVSITVVDTAGRILGIFRTIDAPIFGFDVSAQKARSANFFTRTDAATRLTSAGMGAYVTALTNEGLPLNGSTAFSDRAIGFLSQPIFPPGASSNFLFGPLSKPLGQWSIFNTGLQLDSINLANVLSGTAPCTSLAGLQNGLQIFPGSVPLFRGNTHIGAVGVSGDGVDQDDIIAAMGSVGFEAPAGIRADSRTVRSVRLPYLVFPRNPNLF